MVESEIIMGGLIFPGNLKRLSGRKSVEEAWKSSSLRFSINVRHGSRKLIKFGLESKIDQTWFGTEN